MIPCSTASLALAQREPQPQGKLLTWNPFESKHPDALYGVTLLRRDATAPFGSPLHTSRYPASDPYDDYTTYTIYCTYYFQERDDRSQPCHTYPTTAVHKCLRTRNVVS